jgi:peptide/nickel transport system substrate-binding protein
MRMAEDWDTLDPQTTEGVAGSYQIYMMLYDRLIALDQNGNPIPELAESWDVKTDSVTLKLKQGITCSDGAALTPSAVADSIKRLGDPKTGSNYAARTLGSAGFTVTADDGASTVQIKTNQPFSDLLLGLAMPWSSIICPAGLKNPDALKTQAYGTGPYTLQKSVRGDSYTLAARSDYNWGPNGASVSSLSMPQTIIFKVVVNDTTAANLLLTNGLDIGYVRGRDLDRVANDKSLTRVKGDPYGTTFVIYNQAQGLPGADPVVRQAISTAVDAAGYNKAQNFGQGEVAYSVITPAVPCYDPATQNLVPKADPDAARALLEKAGWKTGADNKLTKDGKPLTVRIIGWQGQNAGPEFILESLEAAGFTGKLNSSDMNTLGEALFGTGDWDVALFPFTPPMPSPNTISSFVTGPAPDKGSNVGHISNAQFDQARAAALAALGQERCTHWAKAQEALLQDYDLKPLTADTYNWFGRNVDYRTIGGGQVIDPFSIKRK